MRINTSVLTTFLKRCIVSTHGVANTNVISMPDLLLVVEGNQMKVEGLSPSGSIQIEFVETLSEEFEREEFPIVDSVLFHKIVNSEFKNDEIEMVMSGNDILLTSEKVEVRFPTINMVETMKKYPEAAEKIRDTGYGRAEFKTIVTLNAIELASSIGTSGGTYNLYTYDFEVKDNKFTIGVKTDDKGSVIKKPTSEVDGVDCSAKYSSGIDSVFKGFVGKVKLYFNQDAPLMAVDEVNNKCIFFPLDN